MSHFLLKIKKPALTVDTIIKDTITKAKIKPIFLFIKNTSIFIEKNFFSNLHNVFYVLIYLCIIISLLLI